jgi:glycosyltransferase involved in cell wall biosynthesis
MQPNRALTIGMVAYGDISHDSRVQREATSLAEAGHLVTLFALAAPPEPPKMLDPRVRLVVRPPTKGAVVPGSPSPFHSSATSSRIGRVLNRFGWVVGYARGVRAWGRGVLAEAPGMDVWHVHDFAGLIAIGGSLRGSARLVYDVHDLFVETGTGSRLPGLVRRAVRRYERHLVRRADLVVAVNQPLADIVRARTALDRSSSSTIAPTLEPAAAAADLIRTATGIPATAPVVLYHGLLSANRGIDRLTEAILQPGLEDVHLALLGYGTLAPELTELADQAPYRGRLHVLDAVPPAELLPWVASADVGSLAMPRASLNLFISTPNKLFECLAAGTPVVVSDFPAVRDIVMGDPLGPLGTICDPGDAGDVARAIQNLLEVGPDAREALRRRCLEAAVALELGVGGRG